MNKKIPSLKDLTDFLSPYAAKLKNLIPTEKPRLSVGLDIGTTSVKLIQLQKDVQGYKLTRYGIAQIKNDNREEAIKGVIGDEPLATKEVNIAVSGQGVILRYVPMPKMPIEELRASILFESDKYMPFPPEEVITDCYIIKDLPKENKILVLVAAAKKDLIEQKISLLEKVGLIPQVISIDSVALANVFHVFCQTPAVKPPEQTTGCQAVGVLNLGGVFSSLNILDKGLPLFTRDIFIGGQDITKKIMNQFGLDMESAEKMKTSPEVVWQQIFEACETSLSNLITEIRFSFDYFETENNIPISLMYITGGGAYLKGLDNYLQQNLGIKIEIWNPISGLQISPHIAEEPLRKQANKVGIALGLALYQND